MPHSHALAYAVRPRAVLRHLGQVLVGFGALLVVPTAVALATGGARTLLYGGLAAAFCAVGFALSRLRFDGRLQTNEAMLVVVLAFVLAPAAMAVPFVTAGLAPVDALFEAVSGITTTGLSMIGNPAGLPPDVLFSRAWLQWVGGLGIASFAAVLAAGSPALARHEAVGETHDLGSSARSTGRRAFLAYAGLTVAGIGVLWLLGVGPIDAAGHVLAAVSTGGFSTHGNSLAGLDGWTARAVVIALCVAGAVPVALYSRIRRGRFRAAAFDPQLLALMASIGVVTITLLLLGPTPGPPLARLGHAALTAASAQTTAGFASFDVSQLAPAGIVVLILSMIVGGGTGSTAGGLKLLRLLVAVQVIRGLMARAARPPHSVQRTGVGSIRLEGDVARDVLAMMLLYAGVVLLSWFPFLLDGYPPLGSLFEVVSATGTVGLSAGITGPDLPAALKLVLCFDMLLGRLEILAVLAVLSPRTWIGRRVEPV